MTFSTLVHREPRALAFGLLYITAATVGQTFLISLFLPGIKTSLALGDAQISLLFTLATLASAAALLGVGSWIDRTDLVRYAVSCGLLVALSCALMAAAPLLAAFAAGLFGLRLAGNGLLTHVAVTATARYFTHDRGRALAIVLLGTSLGEGLLPAVLVPLIAAWGWRWTLFALGCLALALTLAGARGVRDHAAFRRPSPVARPAGSAASPAEAPRKATARSQRQYFAFTAPLFAAMWVFITATIFHQALVAEVKGMSLHAFAVSFIAFAVVRVPVSVLTGRIVDRIGPAWVLCAHLAPLAAGTIALIVIDTPWVAAVYWLGAGITSGMGTVVQSTVVAERVPRERLGSARSALGVAGIVASAAGPSLYGYALAAGASMIAILWASVAFFAVATALGVIATRSEMRAASAPS